MVAPQPRRPEDAEARSSSSHAQARRPLRRSAVKRAPAPRRGEQAFVRAAARGRRYIAVMLVLFAMACTPTLPYDSSTDTASVEVQTPQACRSVDFRIDGSEAPQVGDTWAILLTCDGDVATGAMRIAFDPPDFVSWEDEIYATFRRAGTATLHGQVGTVRASRPVTVSQ